jgi:hypothetical protein
LRRGVELEGGVEGEGELGGSRESVLEEEEEERGGEEV